jgi:DNA-binding XRE family transcriptional regulator
MTEIEKRRKEKGFTQQYMAERIESSLGCYNMYENNQRKVPKEKALLISEVLECNLDDIFIPSSFTVSEIVAKEI